MNFNLLENLIIYKKYIIKNGAPSSKAKYYYSSGSELVLQRKE